MSTGDELPPDPTIGRRPSVPPPPRPPDALEPDGAVDRFDPAPGADPVAGVDASDPGAGVDPDPGAGARPSRRFGAVVLGGLLLVAAVVLELAALGASGAPGQSRLDHQASTVAPPVVLAVGFALAVVLLFVPRRRASPAGAALVIGLVVADAGLLVSQLGGDRSAYGSLGRGDGLLIAAWGAAALGALAAVVGQRGRLGRPGRPHRRDNALLASLTLVVGVVIGVALLPAWDRYHLTFTGGTQTVLAGSAFQSHTPGAVLAGDLVAAVLFALVPLFAVLWRPGRIGALASLGVVFVVVGQGLSAVLQVSETQLVPTFARSEAIARAADLTVRTSLTGWYDAEVVAVVALLLLVVARWWTPAGGSLLDSYPFGRSGEGESRPSGAVPPGVPSGWGPPLVGSTARPGPGHIGHGAPPAPTPPPGFHPGAPWGSTAGGSTPGGSTAGHH